MRRWILGLAVCVGLTGALPAAAIGNLDQTLARAGNTQTHEKKMEAKKKTHKKVKPAGGGGGPVKHKKIGKAKKPHK